MKKYKQKGILVSLVLLTITLRGFKYGSLLVLLQSQLVAFEQPLAMTELPKALIGMLSSEAAASLPFSGIGGFGLYEGVWAASFSLLGFEPWLSAVTGVAHHLFTQAWGVILAALAFIALTIQRSFSLPGFKLIVPTSSKLAWGLSLCGLLLLSPLPLLITSSHGADSQREAVSEQRIAERPNGLLSGTVLYDSNEKGSFDIFAYNLETQESRTVVSSKMHEQHPVFHPAQAKVLFHRAPSSNRYAPSDIIALDIKDRTETILFKNAHFASLFGDKERIVFGRARKEVFIGNLVNGQEEKIFPNKRFSEFRRAEIVRPVLSQDENFLSFVSSYPRRWTVWRIALDGSSRISIPDSCQPSFSQNTEFSFVSLSAARAGTGIHFFDGTNSKLLDRNDPFGKEYFPFLQDSRWLFFSACSSHEHSHTSANYEVFLQDLQKSALYQLTSNGATNRWPHYSADEFLRKLFE